LDRLNLGARGERERVSQCLEALFSAGEPLGMGEVMVRKVEWSIYTQLHEGVSVPPVALHRYYRFLGLRPLSLSYRRADLGREMTYRYYRSSTGTSGCHRYYRLRTGTSGSSFPRQTRATQLCRQTAYRYFWW
jgi:hypothetical protein